MKKRVIVKGIINYIAAMVFAIIFALFLDANVGLFIVLTLLLAPLLSVFLAWLSSRMVTLSCEMEEALLSKGDTCTMQLSVQNRSIFPTPPLDIQLTNEAGARCEKPELLVTVLPRAAQEFQVVFRAKICGGSMVGIERVQVTDYLGLFSFPVRKVDYASLQRKVAVIPDMAEISARDDNLVKVMQTSLHADDSDDTVEACPHAFGGFAGYDNREYVPGDPIRRINWKQSAKRNRLLVRLDDEMASKAVNVVLDSVFCKKAVDIKAVSLLQQYQGLRADEILPKMAEDAVENALGIMQVLIRHGYTIRFHAMMEGAFCRYEITDEPDLEAVRLELAHYSFAQEGVARSPKGDAAFQNKVSLFSTPNSYEEAYEALEGQTDAFYTNIYSVPEEAKKHNNEGSLVSLQEVQEKKEEKLGAWERIASAMAPLVIPYFLALLLSVSVFGVFKVPVLSYWTLGQAVVCAGVIALCEFVQRHRLVGTLFIIVFGVGDLYTVLQLIGSGGNLLTYTYWFVSGGDEIESSFAYLMTLILIFTVFFAMVVFYFNRVLYRTSFLMLVSLIPFVIYVKVMLDINMVQVVFITVLNVAAFLVHNRTGRDRGKRIVGYQSSLVSFGLYAVLFVLIGLAVPEVETRYYYMFENAFLGGNVSERVPEEYSRMSEHSGNADGFNVMNNRKLYVITWVDGGTDLYMNRQAFDWYDFEKDYWYPSENETATRSPEAWEEAWNRKNLELLVEALVCAQEYEPRVLAKYGLEQVLERLPELESPKRVLHVEAMNFQSVAYITPQDTIKVEVQRNDGSAMENTCITPQGIFYRSGNFLNKDIEYTVEYYDEAAARNAWIAAGGANFDAESAYKMLADIENILSKNGEQEYAETVYQYALEAWRAMQYQQDCAENTELIPESVKELALSITKDCTYAWEKARALQNYFRENNFVYDLEYDPPDDSVEYFLFEGKTGTCSDYASAYVLLARAAGLTVRYMEGFVPDAEYNGDYVARTNNGHAYPAVYIPNVGYVVYEATMPAGYSYGNPYGSGMMTYILTVLFRVVYVFAVVSVVIILLLFGNRIVAPSVREKYFLSKVKRASAGEAVVLLYRRLQQGHAKDILRKGGISTPYEYAERFEGLLGYDISELALMVETAVYAEGYLSEEQKARAGELYQGAKEAVKGRRKNKVK